MAEFIVFKVDALRIGLRASSVGRVVHSVEITPLPRAPDIALGVIDIRGTIIPVINFRKRLGLPDREITLDDRFVIAHTAERSLGIVADAIDGILEYAESDLTDPSILFPRTSPSGNEQISGIANRKDGIIFIHDLERFLSPAEATALDSAIAIGQGAQGDVHAS